MSKRIVTFLLVLALALGGGFSAAADEWYGDRCDAADAVLHAFYQAHGGEDAVREGGLLAGVYLEVNKRGIMHIALTDEAVVEQMTDFDILPVVQEWCAQNETQYEPAALAEGLVVWEYKPYALSTLKDYQEALTGQMNALHITTLGVYESENVLGIGVEEETQVEQVRQHLAAHNIPADAVKIQVSGPVSLDIEHTFVGTPWYIWVLAGSAAVVILGGGALLLIRNRRKKSEAEE